MNAINQNTLKLNKNILSTTENTQPAIISSKDRKPAPTTIAAKELYTNAGNEPNETIQKIADSNKSSKIRKVLSAAVALTISLLCLPIAVLISPREYFADMYKWAKEQYQTQGTSIALFMLVATVFSILGIPYQTVMLSKEFFDTSYNALNG